MSTKTAELDGVDASSGLLGHVRGSFYKSFERADLGRPWNRVNKYDVVFSIEVIEHVQDYRQFLRNAFLALEPGGHMFLTTTTYFWSLFILLIIFRRRRLLRHYQEFCADSSEMNALEQNLSCAFGTISVDIIMGFQKRSCGVR